MSVIREEDMRAHLNRVRSCSSIKDRDIKPEYTLMYKPSYIHSTSKAPTPSSGKGKRPLTSFSEEEKRFIASNILDHEDIKKLIKKLGIGKEVVRYVWMEKLGTKKKLALSREEARTVVDQAANHKEIKKLITKHKEHVVRHILMGGKLEVLSLIHI